MAPTWSGSAEFPDRSVCVLGLGYVGLTLAVTMADVGFDVTGVEIRDDVLDKLARGEPHFFEPGLREKLARVVARKKFRFAKHIPEGNRSTVYIITVGTPLGQAGQPQAGVRPGVRPLVRMDMIESVSREIARHLREGDLVVMRSTVKLGTTRNVVTPILRERGVKFDLAFCPERTLEGQAMKELRELPQIVGGISFESTLRAARMFQMITPTVVKVDDVETAEMVKLVDNTSRDVGFAFANEIARVCDAIGISASQVISAGKLGYPRTNLPMPGPVGGPCLEKDSYILAEGLAPYRLEPQIILTARKLNERQPEEVAAHLARVTKEWKDFSSKPVICLMGLAFKGRPATDDLRGTMARPALEALRKHFPNARFTAFDPVVSRGEIEAFGGETRLEAKATLEEAFAGASLCVILNNHPVFAGMNVEALAERMARPALVYDFWNTFNARELHLAPGVGYMALGSHGRALRPDRPVAEVEA